MRIVTLISLMLLMCPLTHAQYESMPEALNKEFYERFPDAESVYWYVDDDHFRIEFELETDTYTALFTQKGSWIETSKIIVDTDVPAKVLSALTVKCADCEISYCEFVENVKTGIFYRITSYTDEAYYVMDINREGAILNFKKQAINY